MGPEHSDASNRLGLLRRLPESAFGRTGHIYIDGFTDFTGVEMKLLCELMGRGADMTVCLTLDALDEGSEVFELSRRTARRLLREARERGVPSRVETLEARSARSADILAEHMLSYTEQHFDSDNSVFLYTAESVTAECELAASRAIELARSGCRWRDIAVAVRSFEDYRAQLEAAFAYYGVPLFTARQTDITQKPLPALISSAYEAVLGGWEQAEVFAYLRTGLAGLDAAECDELRTTASPEHPRLTGSLSGTAHAPGRLVGPLGRGVQAARAHKHAPRRAPHRCLRSNVPPARRTRLGAPRPRAPLRTWTCGALASRADDWSARAACRPRTSMRGSGTRRSPRSSSARDSGEHDSTPRAFAALSADALRSTPWASSPCRWTWSRRATLTACAAAT
ncbi:MAG: hypothetical protein ACLUEK_05455 [Oscillospiraceae bacterium]